jgi:hypothetical protein
MKKQERRELAGKELFEITPVILGGSSTDPANKVVLNRNQHIEAVRYWNRIIGDLRRTQTK